MIKNLLGLDVGKSSLGISISRTGFLVTPVENLRFKNLDFDLPIKFIKDLLNKENVEIFVIGLPLFPSGDECEMTQVVKDFAKLLKVNFPDIRQIFQDERYSTLEASNNLHEYNNLNCKKQHKIIDKMASVVILERYLRSIGQIT